MNAVLTTRTRRALRAAAVLLFLASMLKAMAVPVMASPAFWSVKIARASVDCRRGLGFCIDLFDVAAGTPSARVSLEVVGAGSDGMTNGRLRFLHELNETGDTFEIDQDITLDRKRSLELGYQSVTLVKGRYPIDRTNDPNGEVLIGMRTIGITITIDIGRKAYGCTRFGACSVTVGFELGRANTAPGSATLEGDRMSVEFLQKIETEEDSTMFYVDEDITLDEETSLALGAKRITILKGAYAVDYGDNPNGSVDFNVQRFGITVTIDIGRKSYDCTGAGICEISVELDFAMKHPTPAVLSVARHMLTIDFATRPQTGDEPFVLDESYGLDPAIARALGRKSAVLAPGSYAVDYSSNPNGRVTVPITDQGIVITIYFGRPRDNCRGFGFCDIVIEASWSERTVGAIGSIDGGVLSIDLLGAAPEKGEILMIDDDLELSPDVARALGYHNVTLKRGSYRVDYSSNPNGHVEIPVATIGVTIKFNFGRAYADCQYKGLCSITIDFTRQIGRPVYGNLTRAGAMLELEMSESMPEQTDTLYIDEDIVLDPETARALGSDSLTIKRGAYLVDFDDNPNGSVRLVLNDDGTSSADDERAEGVGMSLSAWPNPASETATVRFATDGIATVRLDLLDARGAVVRSIIGGERLERGSHELTVDVSDLPAGAYFQRLTLGSTSAISPLQITR